MSDSWAGRTALVTGAAGDIGRAVAVRLAAVGATLVLTDLERATSPLQETADRCEAAGSTGPPPTVHFDVTHHDGVAKGFEEIIDAVGVPDLIFNNAGYQGSFVGLADYPIDDFRRVLDVNVTGVFSVLQAAARHLIDIHHVGAIVNMASMAGVSGAPNMAAYSASKSAVIGLTKSAAKDLAPFGLRVNSVSPAFIGPGMMWDRQVELQAAADSQYFADTTAEVEQQMINQVPLRRYGSLDEVASVVLFLLSDESSYITGFNVEVSGGAG